MKVLIREKLSPHKFKTPEGYLICQDAILARTGKQTYRKNELFLDTDDDSEIEVDRPYDEVFSQETLASFENKPVTIEHPDEDVTIDNYKDYAVGFVRDIRQSKVGDEDVIIGNLVITDKDAIDKIESGEMVELSCGYDCDIVDDDNPKQTHIRGNHIALCEQGRAGIAKIVDSVNDKESASVREAISLLEGDLANEYGYTLDRNNIIYGNGRKYPISTQVYMRLKELGYDKQSMKTSNVVYVPTMNLKEMQNYCDIYRCNVSQVGNRKYKLEGADANRVIKELKGDGFVSDSIKDEHENSLYLNERYIIEKISGASESVYWTDDFEDAKEELRSLGRTYRIWDTKTNKYYMLKDIKDSVKDDFKKDMKSILKSKLSSMSTQYSIDEVYNAIMKLYNKKPYLTLDDCMNQVLNNIRNGNYLLDSVKDSQYKLKLEKKTNDYDEYVIACYKDGKYFEDGTYYTDDWDDAVGTMKDMSRRMGLNLRQQGRGYIADSTQNSIQDSTKLYKVNNKFVAANNLVDAVRKVKNEKK